MEGATFVQVVEMKINCHILQNVIKYIQYLLETKQNKTIEIYFDVV
jgi:hypothetical protein